MMFRLSVARVITATLVIATAVTPSIAQSVDGYVSVMGDLFPSVRLVEGEKSAVGELRMRVFAERRFDISNRIRFTTSGFAEGLIANRHQESVTRAGIVRPQELHVEAAWQRADLRVGFSRVVWGRLDEFLPTDVVNPQDLTRFFLEGRAEGRMPVGMVRARLLPSDRFALEAIYVPVFRRGRFDQLDEDTSPINVSQAILVVSHEPPRTLESAQGGARASVTTGRVDWSMSAYRGFESFPIYQAVPAGEASAVILHERFPRYTMIGGDFETVRGMWGLRGETAVFVDRTLQAVDSPTHVAGRTLEAGVGLDRKSGAYRFSANVIVSKRWTRAGGDIDETDLTLVSAIDRSFARDTRTVRAFAVYNPGEDSAFARVISTISLRDNVSFEASGGWFTGSGVDALSRLATRDFVYARVKVFF